LIDHAHLKIQLGYAGNKLEVEHKSSQELSTTFKQIVNQITSKGTEPYSEEDLLQIAIIVDQLSDLSQTSFYLNPRKMKLATMATAAKQEILNYLRKNQPHTGAIQIGTPNLLLFSSDRQGTSQQIEFESVKPLLSLRL